MTVKLTSSEDMVELELKKNVPGFSSMHPIDTSVMFDHMLDEDV